MFQGRIDQRDAGAHLDLVSERRVARIEPADLVDRGQHAAGAAGEHALFEHHEVADRREPEAAQRLSARADAGRPHGAADPRLRAEEAGEEPAGDVVRVDVVLDGAARRRDADAVGGGREALQLCLELDALAQEARQRQLAGLDQHGVRHLARRDSRPPARRSSSGWRPRPSAARPSSTTRAPAAGRVVHGAPGTRMPRASSATSV